MELYKTIFEYTMMTCIMLIVVCATIMLVGFIIKEIKEFIDNR